MEIVRYNIINMMAGLWGAVCQWHTAPTGVDTETRSTEQSVRHLLSITSYYSRKETRD